VVRNPIMAPTRERGATARRAGWHRAPLLTYSRAMDARFPYRMARLSRRLMRPPRALRRALQDASDLLPALLEPWRPTEVAEVARFGANPGRLRMLLQLPPRPPRPGAPLLVLLHGCGQDARQFAAASGFAALAARLGAALLLPEQQAENNRGRCFNWFRPADFSAGSGEAASLRQMVFDALIRARADPARVYVAGLSAGGAMAAALLAAYPDLFAGGAVIAGMPVGTAHDMASALARMERATDEDGPTLAARLARRPGARWPRLSVWHGTADRVVDPANSDALVAQWTALHGLTEVPGDESEPAPGLRRRIWGRAVEQWSLSGFGHAFPIADGASTDPYVLPAGIAASEAIARFWGLLPG
jgi:poly(hydroxyalkanoate) depolymerase family esterase